MFQDIIANNDPSKFEGIGSGFRTYYKPTIDKSKFNTYNNVNSDIPQNYMEGNIMQPTANGFYSPDGYYMSGPMTAGLTSPWGPVPSVMFGPGSVPQQQYPKRPIETNLPPGMHPLQVIEQMARAGQVGQAPQPQVPPQVAQQMMQQGMMQSQVQTQVLAQQIQVAQHVVQAIAQLAQQGQLPQVPEKQVAVEVAIEAMAGAAAQNKVAALEMVASAVANGLIGLDSLLKSCTDPAYTQVKNNVISQISNAICRTSFTSLCNAGDLAEQVLQAAEEVAQLAQQAAQVFTSQQQAPQIQQAAQKIQQAAQQVAQLAQKAQQAQSQGDQQAVTAANTAAQAILQQTKQVAQQILSR